MKNPKETKKEIVLNKMFVGSYLNDNIGHEIINLYKDDKGDNYIYLQALGNFDKKHSGKVDCVLMVRYIGDKTLEILSKATGLEEIYGKVKDQKQYIIDNDIRYGGKLLSDIFSHNSFQQDVDITYKAAKVVKPKERLYIQFPGAKFQNPNLTKENTIYISRRDQAKSSLKQYFANNEDSNYSLLDKFIKDESLWGEELGKVDINNSTKLKFNYYNILGVQYNELVFSNVIKYFIEKYPDLAIAFAKELGLIDSKCVSSAIKVQREFNNIDIFIESENYYFIIENKIKSGINGIKLDNDKNFASSQLDKYLEVVAENEKIKVDKEVVGIVLVPNYNDIDIDKYLIKDNRGKYHKLTYSQLYDFMIKQTPYSGDSDYKAFVDAMYQHTQKVDDLFGQVEYKFIETIKNI